MNIDIIDIDTIDATQCRIDGFVFDKSAVSVSAYGDQHAQVVADGQTFIASIGSAVDGRRPIGQTALLFAIESMLSGGGSSSGTSLVLSSTQTGSYTLVLGDAGKSVVMNSASSNTLTVPPNSSVAFSVGTVISVEQFGAGSTTIAAGVGVTLRSRDSALSLGGQYSVACLRKVATNEWIVSGDLV